MLRGGLDPRQVPMQGLEGRCNALLDEFTTQSRHAICQHMLTDANFPVPQYALAVPHPLSLQTIRAKVSGAGAAQYLYLNEFAFDVRRVLGNFLRFNFDLKARKAAFDVLQHFELWWARLQGELQASAHPPGRFFFQQPLPELRWVMAAYDVLTKIKVPAAPAASGAGKKLEARLPLFDFNAPITYYLGGENLLKYRALVPNPICYGDIVSSAVEGEYADLASLKADVCRIGANCVAYWSQNTENGGGEGIIEDALRLEKALVESLESSAAACARGDPKAALLPRGGEVMSAGAGAGIGSATAASAGPHIKLKLKAPSGGARLHAGVLAQSTSAAGKSKVAPSLKASSPPQITYKAATQQSRSAAHTHTHIHTHTAHNANVERRAQKLFKALLQECMRGVEMHNVVNRHSGSVVQTAAPFMHAVDGALYPDYALLIKEPMDLGKIHNRIEQGDTRYSLSGGPGGPDRAVANVLRDVELLRVNAHEYNQGVQSTDVRVMADHVAHYFRHTLKVGLRLLADADTYIHILIHTYTHTHTHTHTHKRSRWDCGCWQTEETPP
jgi:hypothetical protein